LSLFTMNSLYGRLSVT